MTSLRISRRFFSSKPFASIPTPPVVPGLGTLQEFGTRVQQTDLFHAVGTYYNEYGNVLKHNFAGKEEVWLFHPDDVLSAYRQEGKYPSGIGSEAWATEKYDQDRKIKYQQLLAKGGPEWQEGRRKLQKDMFPPQVAESYLPLLDEPVRLISQQFPKVKKLDDITPYAATDMFFTIMIGINPKTVLGINGNPNKEADPEDLQFVDDVNNWLQSSVLLIVNPAWNKDNPGPVYPKFEAFQTKILEKNRYYLDRFLKSEEEKNKAGHDDDVKPYFRRLFDRGEITQDQLPMLFSGLLGAGVDTTHHTLIWLLIHLGTNPDKQEILRKELKNALGDGPLEISHLRLPYLNQCIRESHRLSPVGGFSGFRRLPDGGEIAGYKIPAETKITFCLNHIQKDPKFVDDADKFIPERWSPQAVESRKGTEKEILDHKLLAKPFGFGPRMCLGSRLAETELKAVLSRLVRDWRFEPIVPNPQYKLLQGTLIRPDPCPGFKFEKVN